MNNYRLYAKLFHKPDSSNLSKPFLQFISYFL